MVRSQFAFDLLRCWKRGTLRAGEYRFDHPAPVTEVYARIARGDVYTKAVTIPEGANIFDIAARLEQAGFGTQQEFLDEATQQTAWWPIWTRGQRVWRAICFRTPTTFRRKATPAQIARRW